MSKATPMRGVTVAEMTVVLTISALVMMIAISRGRSALDRVAVRSAADDIRITLHHARTLAMAGGVAVAVDVDSATGTLRVRRGSELILTRGIGHAHGVRISGSRDSLTYDPRGFGRGAANLSVLVRRGISAETVFVSRLGRVR